MRWRIETGMGVIAPLWHTIAFPASYIIYGNALASTGRPYLPDLRPPLSRQRCQSLEALRHTPAASKSLGSRLSANPQPSTVNSFRTTMAPNLLFGLNFRQREVPSFS